MNASVTISAEQLVALLEQIEIVEAEAGMLSARAAELHSKVRTLTRVIKRAVEDQNTLRPPPKVPPPPPSRKQ